MTSVTCPSCQAVFEIDFAPGTEFACGDCGATVVVPKPLVVQPKRPGPARAGPAPASSAPAVRAPAPAPAPVDAAPPEPAEEHSPAEVAAASAVTRMAATPRVPSPIPAPGKKPVARPGAARGGAAGARPPRAGAAADRAAPPKHRPSAAERFAEPESKKKMSPVLLGGLAVVALGAIAGAYFAFAGPDKPKVPDATTKPSGTPSSSTSTASEGTPAAPVEKSTDPYEIARVKARDGSTEDLLAFADMSWTRTEEARAKGDKAAIEIWAKDYRSVYAEILKKDPEHALARERLGFVRYDKKEAADMLALPFLTRTLTTDLELAVDEINGKYMAEKTTAWLNGREPAVASYATLKKRIDEMVATEKARKTDPFYTDADRMGQSLVEQFSKPVGLIDFHMKGIKGDAFEAVVIKPYVLLIQRGEEKDEKRIAEEWGELLMGLQRAFYAKFGKATGLDPMNKPTPVIVLRDALQYAKYIRLRSSEGSSATPVTSSAHYEPWSNRLVCWMMSRVAAKGETDGFDPREQERETVMHEATHQIVEFAMKTAGSNRGMGQSLWFSEGIADYFGGHATEWNEAKKEWTFVPGMINVERLRFIASAKARNGLFPLTELLDYSRAAYEREKEDSTKALRVLNGYAQGWGLMFFLNNWQDGKYREKFVEYLKEEFRGNSGRKTFEKVFGAESLPAMEKEFLDMIEELGKAEKDGRIVKGKLLPK